ncbi:hypothetical protein [Larkinella bovis]|uniref:hypothetical protein n=1 Tax=Larkinella bovis TaxID=683041 RepID=UPI0036D316B1
MFLYFSYLSSDGYTLNCSLHSESLEIHLDTLNSFVAFGYGLIEAYLIDEEGRRTDLPIEVFDGRPIGPHLRELQEQYQLVLSF